MKRIGLGDFWRSHVNFTYRELPVFICTLYHYTAHLVSDGGVRSFRRPPPPLMVIFLGQICVQTPTCGPIKHPQARFSLSRQRLADKPCLGLP